MVAMLIHISDHSSDPFLNWRQNHNFVHNKHNKWVIAEVWKQLELHQQLKRDHHHQDVRTRGSQGSGGATLGEQPVGVRRLVDDENQ